MSQLLNSLDAVIQAAAKIKPGQRMSQVLNRYQQRQAGTPYRCVLADVSSSMAEMSGTLSKINVLRNALMQPTVNWQNLDLIAFSSTVTPVAGPVYLPQPSGSTALHRALSYIQAKRPSYTLVISDGRPDDANAALAEADKLTGIIDVLYVGPDSDVQAIAFMQLLASRTGGRVVVNDIGKRPNELASGIRGLLN